MKKTFNSASEPNYYYSINNGILIAQWVGNILNYLSPHPIPLPIEQYNTTLRTNLDFILRTVTADQKANRTSNERRTTRTRIIVIVKIKPSNNTCLK